MWYLSSRETLTKIALIIIGIFIGVAAGELGMRTLFPTTGNYYAHRPFLQITFEPSPSVMPGLNGKSRYLVNSRGIRGEEFSNDQTYRILAVGGSTTECNYLDQSRTWTYLLQKKLNECTKSQKVWVGNVGKGGITTRHHILQLKHFLRQYPGIDAIIMLVGINDFSRRLAEDVNYDPCFLDKPGCEEKLLLEAFSLLPVGRNWALPYYKRTALWHLARKFKYRMFSLGQIQDIKGNYLVEWRKYRKDAVVIRNVLPDLSSALEEYSRNINTIIDMAQKKSVRPIFVTQPFLWRPDLPQHFKDLLWFGGIGKFGQEEEREYYSVEALAAGMKMYNETLMKICNERQIECFDLASFVTKDTTVFYDDCHFNTSGAEKIATILARYMLQCEPFSNYVKDNEERMAAQHD